MPDESIPHIQMTNQLLNELLKSGRSIQEQLAGQQRQLQEGFSHVRQGVVQQTSTLVDLQILSRLAELQSLLGTIEQESQDLAKEGEEDSAALDKLAKFFERTYAEISALRNRRVRELLAPVYSLLDDHHDKHIEDRFSDLPEVLGDYQKVTGDVVKEREEALRQAVEATQAKVGEFLELRASLRKRVSDLQVNPAFLKVDESGEAYALPFYVVEIEHGDGRKEARLIPPSRLTADPSHLFGIRLHPLTEFLSLKERLSGILAALQRLGQSTAQSRSEPVADALAEQPSDSLLSRLARKLMRNVAAEGSWKLAEGGPQSAGLLTAYRHHTAENLCAEPEPRGNALEREPLRSAEVGEELRKGNGDLDPVLVLIREQRFEEALAMLDQMILQDSSQPILYAYRQFCQQELKTAGGGEHHG